LDNFISVVVLRFR